METRVFISFGPQHPWPCCTDTGLLMSPIYLFISMFTDIFIENIVYQDNSGSLEMYMKG